MQSPQLTGVSKKKSEKQAKKKSSAKKLIIAREIKFARLLSSNNQTVRNKVLKNLKKWLIIRSKSSFAFTDNDFIRLWKGLFYCMWMSDKPLVQEELAEYLSQIIHCFDSRETALLYIRSTFKSLAAEWFGIDRYRVDKFEMLLRKILRQIFMVCKKHMWDNAWVVEVAKIIEEFLLDPGTCLGLSLHLTEVYMEELAKASDERTTEDVVTEFVRPYAVHLAAVDDVRQIRHVMRNIFRYLIFQSDVGMDYMEKFEVWKEAGFPCKSIDDVQKEVIEDDETADEEENAHEETVSKSEEKHLDPRAGKVDVELPQLRFNPREIAALLMKYKFQPSSTTKTRRQITRLIKEFTDLADDKMPIGIKEIKVPMRRKSNSANKKAAERLLAFEDEIFCDSLKRKRNKRKNKVMMPEEHLSNGTSESGDISSEDELESSETEDYVKPSKQQKLTQSSDTESDESPEVLSQKIKSPQSQKGKTSEKAKSPKSTVTSPNRKMSKASNDQSEIFADVLQKLQMNKSRKRHSISCVDNMLSFPSSKPRRRYSLQFVESDVEPQCSMNENNSIPKYSTCNNWDVKTVDSQVPSPTSFINSSSSQNLENLPAAKSVSPKNVSKSNDGNTPWLTPVLTRLEEQKNTPTKEEVVKPMKSNSSTKKKVVIMLQHNTEQHTSEYIRQLRRSPAIPFDANKKPVAGVLKQSSLPSPLNPFYKRKIF